MSPTDNVNSAFGNLIEDKDFSDVTLACEDGQQVEAHKVILAASSPFCKKLLRQNKHSHPLIYMRGMKSDDLFAIVDNWAISKMVFGKNLSGSNPLENMTYPLFSSPTFYMSGQVCVKY